MSRGELCPEFVRQINEGNAFEIDTDFRHPLPICGSELGTKFELDLLRRKDNVDRLRKNFQGVLRRDPICVDAGVEGVLVLQQRAPRRQTTLVPFVYYVPRAKA